MTTIYHCFRQLIATTLCLLVLTFAVWAEEIEFEGLILPHMVVELGSASAGIIAEVLVDRSSQVTQGQTLVRLESSVERAGLGKAAALATFDGEIKLLRTQLELARRSHERIKNLDAIPAQDKDRAVTEVAIINHRLQQALENRQQAEHERKRAQAILNLRTISSPITGVVVDRYVAPGELVSNKVLLRLAQIDPLRVEVIVPAAQFGAIKPGMKATIIPELHSDTPETATVTLVDSVLDSASNTFGVRLALSNSDYRIPSGQRCLVRFSFKEP